MILSTVLFISLFLIIVYVLIGNESFTIKFSEVANAEFRGINLLGDNSTDGHFACQDIATCRKVCGRNNDCKGYSFYAPGQRCYMFMSGDFVPQRPGFYSGKKV